MLVQAQGAATYRVLDEQVTEMTTILIMKRSDEVIRHGLVQHELVHNSMSFACLHLCVVASIDWTNDIPVN
jgi:hypothetical protein